MTKNSTLITRPVSPRSSEGGVRNRDYMNFSAGGEFLAEYFHGKLQEGRRGFGGFQVDAPFTDGDVICRGGEPIHQI